MSEDRCIKWEREYANVETRRRVRVVVKDLGSEDWVYRSRTWFMDRKGRARGSSLFPRVGYLNCSASVHTARSCKRRMDRSMVFELGTDGSPTGPWECLEYDDE